VVPEARAEGHKVAATMGFLAGFLVMMILDVAHG
jgi:zinc transporter ZupT